MRKRDAVKLRAGDRVRLRAGSISALRLSTDAPYTVKFVGGTGYAPMIATSCGQSLYPSEVDFHG